MNQSKREEIRVVVKAHEKIEDELLQSLTRPLKWGQIFLNAAQEQQLAKIQCWDVSILQINHSSKNIIKAIQDIEFRFLKILHLPFNNIQSIEELTQLYMPQLAQLRIQNNKIRSLYLVKIHLHQLHSLSFCLNLVKEMNRVEEIELGSLKQIFMEPFPYTHPTIEDLRFLAKIINKNSMFLLGLSSKRIKNRRVHEALFRKQQRIKMLLSI